jgi:hypothetical protein
MQRHDHRRNNKNTNNHSLKSNEHTWIRQIPELYPDILRSPAVTLKAERDLPRIQVNKYVLFTRPYKGKQGLLIIGKNARPAIIDEESPEKPYLCSMRLDRESILGTWIFGISIYKPEGLIQLEDCIVANGEQLRSTKTFKERYIYMERFCNTMWSKDKEFQGTDIQVAQMFSLESIRQTMATVNSGCICLMPDSPQYRLLKVTSVVHPVTTSATANTITNNEFICSPVEGKPDVYMLTQGGKDMGRASIQTLAISKALQEKRSSDAIKVLCTWNEDFDSYVVTHLL